MNPELSFKNLIANNELSHGYIFWGQGDKLTLSLSLANFLENKKWEVTKGVLLDCLLITDEGIDLVKEANRFLWQKPLLSSRKTLIIKNASTLTHQAQNALLKITEEPPAHGLIILIVNKLEELLPTLLSRFQKIYLPSEAPLCGAKEGLSLFFSEAQGFLKASHAEKKNMVKKLLDAEGDLNEFIKSVIAELDRDPIKNFQPLKSLLVYWTNINQYNTNKRLQLEAWIESFQ